MDLFIFGAGGFGREILDIVRTTDERPFQNLAFLDDNIEAGSLVEDVPVLGAIGFLSARTQATGRADFQVVIGVGSIPARTRIFHKLEEISVVLATIIDRTAVVRPSAQLEPGVIVAAQAFISSNTIIGRNSIVNVGACIGHDAQIGHHCIIDPHASLLGNVRLGSQIEVGTGASIYPGTRVGDNAKIAMGSAVYKDVPAGASVGGNPARIFGLH
jgi:sugar O-acyltransferase (sialic acid O-acetyltransferase NeuD family)